MKFIHTADLHVGASKFLGPEYLERQFGVYDAIIDLAVSRGINTIVVAGDIFDTDEPEEHEKELFLERLLAWDAMGIRILAIRGNHDQSNMQGASAIRYLAHMSDHGVFNHVFAERTQYVRVGDTIFMLLCHKPRYFRDDFYGAIRALKTSTLVPEHKYCVAVVHECLKGSISDTNWRMKDGVDVPLVEAAETVPEHDLTYIAIGDIHIQQQMGPRAFYSGAPMQVKFGDQERKGVLIVDTEDPGNPEFVQITSKRLIKVVADSLEDFATKPKPEDAHVKMVASPKVFKEAVEAGLADGITRFEAVRDTKALDYKSQLDLPSKVLHGLSQHLTGEDLELAKREAASLFSQVNL